MEPQKIKEKMDMEEEKTALVEAKNDLSVSNIEVTGYDIKGMIYVVRNQQVMIDSDLAMLYPSMKKPVKRYSLTGRFMMRSA